MRLRLYFCVGLLMVASLYAQSTPKLPNVAVMDFTGDNTVSADQLKFMTGKFMGELIATDQFTMLDRGKMEYILKEQGFQQSGACNSSECKVQMGQLLGVDYLVAGNLVKFGPEYAFHIEYIDVATGQVRKTVELTQKGDLYEVYKELCSEGARRLATASSPMVQPKPIDLAPAEPSVERSVPIEALPVTSAKPLSTKRKVALALWGTSLLGVGAGAYFNSKGSSYQDDYNTAYAANNYTQTKAAYNKIQDAKTARNASYGISIGTFLLGAVLWFLPEGK